MPTKRCTDPFCTMNHRGSFWINDDTWKQFQMHRHCQELRTEAVVRAFMLYFGVCDAEMETWPVTTEENGFSLLHSYFVK